MKLSVAVAALTIMGTPGVVAFNSYLDSMASASKGGASFAPEPQAASSAPSYLKNLPQPDPVQFSGFGGATLGPQASASSSPPPPAVEFSGFGGATLGPQASASSSPPPPAVEFSGFGGATLGPQASASSSPPPPAVEFSGFGGATLGPQASASSSPPPPAVEFSGFGGATLGPQASASSSPPPPAVEFSGFGGAALGPQASASPLSSSPPAAASPPPQAVEFSGFGGATLGPQASASAPQESAVPPSPPAVEFSGFGGAAPLGAAAFGAPAAPAAPAVEFSGFGDSASASPAAGADYLSNLKVSATAGGGSGPQGYLENLRSEAAPATSGPGLSSYLDALPPKGTTVSSPVAEAPAATTDESGEAVLGAISRMNDSMNRNQKATIGILQDINGCIQTLVDRTATRPTVHDNTELTAALGDRNPSAAWSGGSWSPN